MAEMQLELELGPMMRKAMISGLADMIDALPQYRYAVILELLKRDDVSRVMIAEAIGEEGLLVAAQEAQAEEDGFDFVEKTWDEIAMKVLSELRDTPGGRAEVHDDGAQ